MDPPIGVSVAYDPPAACRRPKGRFGREPERPSAYWNLLGTASGKTRTRTGAASDRGHDGLRTESSPNPTLRENPRLIRALRKRRFAQEFGDGLKKQAVRVAQTSCKTELNGNRLTQRV